MDSKAKLKSLLTGEASLSEIASTNGSFTDGKKVYQVQGNVAVYRKKKPQEDVSSFRPLVLLEKLKQSDVMIFLPDNNRC